MPLTMVNAGEPNVIRKVGGKEETRRFLENLGFVAGGVVTEMCIRDRSSAGERNSGFGISTGK